MDEDINEVLKTAEHMAFLEQRGHLILNPISALPEPRRHIKKALQERIRTLTGAYIALATFVEDEEVFAAMDDPKGSVETYRRVVKNMEAYEVEIKAVLRGLGP